MRPRLDDQNTVDVRRRHGAQVAELLDAYRQVRDRHEQLLALADDLLNIGPSQLPSTAGVTIIAEIDTMFRHPT